MSIQLLEGDVVKLKDGSIWIVKGCVHPPEGFVALPRVVDGRKLKRFSESMEVVRRYYTHYLRDLVEIGRKVPVVPGRDVVEVRRWVSDGLRVGDDVAQRLLQLFASRGLTCGIAGSHLGGYSGSGSDIDVHCLDGPSAYSEVRSLYEEKLLEHLDVGEAAVELSEVSESIDIKVHADFIAKRYLQGRYRGRRVTIRVVNCDRVRDFLGPYVDVRNSELVVKISESDYRTPALLRAEVVRSPSPAYSGTYLISHRLRFAEIPAGSLLSIRGTVSTNYLGYSVLNLDVADIDWISLA
ncbi:MAG: hypothetical protein RMH84_03660 [Sulfolobales archaeon]|nr:hypothetical protein [Sulfolobales archaeon]MCX8208375.1 hypothetical protein [Sulfolobales archaeon]MDW8010671.1 hypothetical protein [Sulfolobales archaeon]